MHLGGAQGVPAFQRGMAGREPDWPTERRQHPLGVIARRVRLADGGRAVCIETRQQQRGLDLRAGDGERIVDPPQRLPAMHVQGWTTAIAALDARTHALQWFDYSRHRPRRQRRIAGQHAVECLAGEHTRQEPHTGAGVAAVDRAGTLQAVQADALHDALGITRRLDAHAHALERTRRGTGVLAFQEAMDVRGALGQRTQHHGPMRNGLVAGDTDLAAQRTARHGPPGALVG